jgi:hypothetical protein
LATKIGEFKGNKTISLYEGNVEEKGYPPFSFGLKKAKLILENIEDIKKFVEETQ